MSICGKPWDVQCVIQERLTAATTTHHCHDQAGLQQHLNAAACTDSSLLHVP